jgi:hypothetical protein
MSTAKAFDALALYDRFVVLPCGRRLHRDWRLQRH